MTAKKKPFNRYSLAEAYEFLHMTTLIPWDLAFEAVEPTPLFHEILKRLAVFDLKTSERGKEVMIDAVLQESLNRRSRLKVWKETMLRTSEISGRAEYVLAEKIDILRYPLVCVVEAKKDDFEKGLAQCLLEMKACQLLNMPHRPIDVYGIVTNAYNWQFYKLTLENQVNESVNAGFQPMSVLFGMLDSVFKECEANLT